MMYTITNPHNRIMRTVSWREIDLENIPDDFPLLEGEVLHVGYYPRSQYSYNGTDFVPLSPQENKPLIEHTEKQILIKVLRDLRASGYALPLHIDEVQTKAQAKELIDQAASRACERFVSKGKFTIVEYQLTQQQVKAWRDADSPTDAVPEMLQSWFDNSTFTTVEDAAQNIEQTAQQFETVIQATRRLRLAGKKAVETATLDDFIAVAESYINQFDAIS
uniref:hypothetical protein n=1 Tax=Ningiella ruwaisensis TaxID=2364274 RepID=UPI00109F9650|nr:hypothetical protein [Ningiella ruwaisensis]